MQSASIINSLQALSKADKPLIVAASELSGNPVTKLEPGQRVQGNVQEQVAPGLYKVLVAGQTLQMALPGNLRIGKQIELQVVSNSPRLTFSFLATTTPIATHEQISPASRLLANLAELPLGRTFIESTGSKAVLQTNGQGIDSKQLAGALRDALANSGLFYESHQAEWVRGARSTGQLLIEPQNRMPQQPRTTYTEIGNLEAGYAGNQPSVAHGIETNAVQHHKATDATAGIPRELMTLVQQQLHTLETHQLTWVGEVWPGQTMQWEIQGEPEHQASTAESRQWSTELELALPTLGDVHARLVFSRGEIMLRLQTDDTVALELFNRNLPELHRAMGAVGIQLTSSVVENHETT
ncbi:MAG: flagellar hook-length control protein FliK [Gallionella sp.]|nr:flagellar hook-length control protein FliK [Gallionella sp.]MDD4945705.1 flagellar hook-length control protein FliK [Gallionella sp.]